MKNSKFHAMLKPVITRMIGTFQASLVTEIGSFELHVRDGKHNLLLTVSVPLFRYAGNLVVLHRMAPNLLVNALLDEPDSNGRHILAEMRNSVETSRDESVSALLQQMREGMGGGRGLASMIPLVMQALPSLRKIASPVTVTLDGSHVISLCDGASLSEFEEMYVQSDQEVVLSSLDPMAVVQRPEVAQIVNGMMSTDRQGGKGVNAANMGPVQMRNPFF